MEHLYDGIIVGWNNCRMKWKMIKLQFKSIGILGVCKNALMKIKLKIKYSYEM